VDYCGGVLTVGSGVAQFGLVAQAKAFIGSSAFFTAWTVVLSSRLLKNSI
jgi:hypothetical protein